MKVLGIGEIILDKSCVLPKYPQEGSKIQPQKVEYSVGGPVPAALILLSRLGIECSLVASVGDDTFGQILKKKLEKDNVRLMPHMQKATKSNTVLVNSENGSRTIIKDGVNHTPIYSISKELLDSVDLIIFDRHESHAFEYVMENKKPETKVIVDPSTEVSPKTLKMLERVDFPIIPYESLGLIRRHENFEENLKHLHSITKKTIIITAGDKGSAIYDGNKLHLIPAVDIKCIDSLGAGDVYRGAFGYGVLNNWDMKRSAEFANLVAGLQCTKIGNGSAIPYKHEIDEFEKRAIKKDFLIEHLIEMI